MQNARSDRTRADTQQLERQVERAGMFTHTQLSNYAERINEVESVLYGLLDVMVKRGAVTPDEVFRAAADTRLTLDIRGETTGPGIALRVDGEPAHAESIEINCAERLHVCKAVCCRLSFALNVKEVESGVVKWDMGRPYFIRQEASGACTHLSSQTKRCTIYGDRPGVCRSYDCTKDERIWRDFDRMELNDEWIVENLYPSQPRLARAFMIRPEEIVPCSEPQGEHAQQRTQEIS